MDLLIVSTMGFLYSLLSKKTRDFHALIHIQPEAELEFIFPFPAASKLPEKVKSSSWNDKGKEGSTPCP